MGRTTGGHAWYDIIPVGAIRGRIHVVRGDILVNKLAYKKETDWKENFFYINRFRVPGTLDQDDQTQT